MEFLKYSIPYELDDPKRTEFHREIILKKAFLKKLYLEWYHFFISNIADLPKDGKLLELGSGGGFFKDICPEIITSDVLPLSYTDMTFSALDMPFKDESISGIFMIDTFHHIPDSEIFLNEALRVLKTGGKIIMVEPCNSFWARLIYKNFHHEPFDVSGDWKIASSGPLSGANMALPWIVFERDRENFNFKFPQFQIEKIKYHTPFRYLLSGGLSIKQLVPDSSFGIFTFIENCLQSVSGILSMFVTITIKKIN